MAMNGNTKKASNSSFDKLMRHNRNISLKQNSNAGLFNDDETWDTMS